MSEGNSKKIAEYKKRLEESSKGPFFSGRKPLPEREYNKKSWPKSHPETNLSKRQEYAAKQLQNALKGRRTAMNEMNMNRLNEINAALTNLEREVKATSNQGGGYRTRRQRRGKRRGTRRRV